MHFTHNFPFLCKASLDSNVVCGTLRFVDVDTIYFSFFSKGTCYVGRELCNRPRSIYHYSNMAPRLSGQTSIFGVVFFVCKSPLGIERQKKLEKFAILTRKPRSHAWILIYRTWPIIHIVHLRLIYEAKYKCYRCFHGNQLSHGTSKLKVCYF